MSDEPPDEMKGKGLPVVGAMPMTHAMFKNAWNTHIVVSPAATNAPKGVDASRAIE